MQLQGLVLVLIMIVVLPALLLSSDHDVFFVLLAIILFFSSIRNVYYTLFDSREDNDEEDEELSETIEDLAGVNFEKFGTGAKVVKNLIIILFYFYCSVFVVSYPLKIFFVLSSLFWVYDIFKNLSLFSVTSDSSPRWESFLCFFISINNFSLILISACNKYIRPII